MCPTGRTGSETELWNRWFCCKMHRVVTLTVSQTSFWPWRLGVFWLCTTLKYRPLHAPVAALMSGTGSPFSRRPRNKIIEGAVAVRPAVTLVSLIVTKSWYRLEKVTKRAHRIRSFKCLFWSFLSVRERLAFLGKACVEKIRSLAEISKMCVML